MYDNEIRYIDIHPKNFMINPNDISKIKTIDFEEHYIKFDDNKAYDELIFSNLKKMIDTLNKLCSINDSVSFLQPDNFDDGMYQIKQMQKRLRDI